MQVVAKGISRIAKYAVFREQRMQGGDRSQLFTWSGHMLHLKIINTRKHPGTVALALEDGSRCGWLTCAGCFLLVLQAGRGSSTGIGAGSRPLGIFSSYKPVHPV